MGKLIMIFYSTFFIIDSDSISMKICIFNKWEKPNNGILNKKIAERLREKQTLVALEKIIDKIIRFCREQY